MNKFKTLVQTSQFLWVLATILMVVNWLRIWDYAFSNNYYVIEDKFIYIGILGGWLFVGFFYLTLIIFGGYFIIKGIKIIAKGVKHDE